MVRGIAVPNHSNTKQEYQQMSNVIYMPYTYLIGWSKMNKWYYGVEYANKTKIANPSNLWTTYFTSSKNVAWMREFYGEPDVVQVRKVFSNKKDALEYERKFLKKINVRKLENFLNISNGAKDFGGCQNKCRKPGLTGTLTVLDIRTNKCKRVTKEEYWSNTFYVHPQKGVALSSEQKYKISIANKGRRRTLEEKKAISDRVSGCNNPNYGNKHPIELKEKWSSERKGKVACVTFCGINISVDKEDFHKDNTLVGPNSSEARRRRRFTALFDI